jgi:hypothetical protein
VVSDRSVNAGRCSSPADHAPGVRLRHRSVNERNGVVPWTSAEEPALAMCLPSRTPVLGGKRTSDATAQRLPEDILLIKRLFGKSGLRDSEGISAGLYVKESRSPNPPYFSTVIRCHGRRLWAEGDM